MRRRQAWAARPKKKERDIRAEYEARFGKKPHHRMKPETILEKLNDAGDIRA